MDIPTRGRIAPDPRIRHDRALLAYGLWLRLFIAGILLVTGGVASVAEGAPIALAAVVAILGGGGLAAFAWGRSAAALARVGGPASDAAAAARGHAHRALPAAIRRRATLAVPQA